MDLTLMVLPFDGSVAFTPSVTWVNELGLPGLELPAVGIAVRARLEMLDPVSQPPGDSMHIFLWEFANAGDVLPSGNILGEIGNIYPANCPCERVLDIIPQLPFLRMVTWCSAVNNWGRIRLKATFDVITRAAYEHLMVGKSSLNNKLARLARQATQLQDKIAEGATEEAEVQEAYVVYSNLMSAEIALYEALNPPA